MASIYFNLCALEVSSVESLIVARSCLPLAMSILNYTFFGRQVPATPQATPRRAPPSVFYPASQPRAASRHFACPRNQG